MGFFTDIPKRFGFLPAAEVQREIGKLKSDIQRVSHEAYSRGAMDTHSRLSKRGYNAGTIDRLSADWNPADLTPDQHWMNAHPRLRSRARDLQMNDGYAANFLRLCRLNIAGAYGFTYQADVLNDDGSQDKLANMLIEEAWKDWCLRNYCTTTGQLSFRNVQHLVIEQRKRDGEYLVAKVYNESKYGFQLQVLETDLLAEGLNKKLDNGNVICLGVELDRARRPVAYWLKSAEETRELYSGLMYGTQQTKRVPAELIYHGFDYSRPFQTRGVTAMAPSMRRMRVLHGYEEAYLEKVRSAAETGGFYERTTSADGTPIAPTTTGPDGEKDERGNLVRNLEPGTFEELPLGIKFVPHDPNFPAASHGDYMVGSLIGVAAGWGPGYNTIANDLRSVSFSSLRNGKGEERELWRDGQESDIESFVEPVFNDWLKMALAVQAVRLPLSKFEKFKRGTFTGRTWDHFDPLADIQARILEILFGLATRSKYAAERGDDQSEIFKKLAEEKAEIEKLGLVLLSSLSATPPVNPDDTQGNGQDKSRALEMQEFMRNVHLILEILPKNGHKQPQEN